MRHPARNRARAVAVLALVLLAPACSSDDDPRPSQPGIGPGLAWVGDLETGDLSQFKETPWNVTRGGEQPEIVDDPEFVREGRYALKVAIPTGETDDNKKGACCDPRAELEPDIGDIRTGDDLWFAFSTKLAADFPTDADWQVITQWKGRADGSPPVSIKVKEGSYVLAGGDGHPEEIGGFEQALAPASPGEWADWVFHIKFSPQADEGFVEAWHNGQQVLQRFSPESATMYPAEKRSADAESYLKTGYYRNGEIERSGVVYFDGWRIGSTREAVALA